MMLSLQKEKVFKGLDRIMPQLNAKTKCDQVVEEITARIMKGEYKPGDMLPPESYFTEYFGVSRVTIRESFKKLNTLGLVTIRQGKGTTVNKVTIGTILQPLYSAILFNEYNAEQIYDVRKILETGAVSLAGKYRTEEEMRKLNKLVEEMERACAIRDTIQFSKLDIEFHIMLVEISKNDVLTTIYTSVRDIINSYIETVNLSMEVVESSTRLHRMICDALVAGETEKAVEYMAEHIDKAKSDILRKVETGLYPNYVK